MLVYRPIRNRVKCQITRILQIVHLFPPERSAGTELYTQALSRTPLARAGRLLRSRAAVRVCCSRNAGAVDQRPGEQSDHAAPPCADAGRPLADPAQPWRQIT